MIHRELPDALARSVEVADRCTFRLDELKQIGVCAARAAAIAPRVDDAWRAGNEVMFRARGAQNDGLDEAVARSLRIGKLGRRRGQERRGWRSHAGLG